MDSFELNKIVGGVLAALLVMIGTSTMVEIASTPHGGHGDHEIVGYKLPGPSGDGDAAGGDATHAAGAPAEFDAAEVVTLVAEASAEKGQGHFKKCQGCHTADQGGKNKIGPNLWGIVGRTVAGVDGFSYSTALKEKGGDWSQEALAGFLHNPKKYVSGTKMVFKGFKKDGQLAEMLAYLNSLK